MSPFRSVGGKLALGLVAVVAGVLAIVYLIVVPLYRTSLQDAALRTLAGQLAAGIVTYPRDPASPYVDQWALEMAEQHGVRAISFEYTPIPPSVAPFADSNVTTDDSDLEEGMAALAAMHPHWQAIVERTGLPPLRLREGGFTGLSSIIVSQQLSVASARAVWNRFESVFVPLTPERLQEGA